MERRPECRTVAARQSTHSMRGRIDSRAPRCKTTVLTPSRSMRHDANAADCKRFHGECTMRIGFFSTMGGLPWGGSEELWCRAAMSLRERGHEVAFNCLKWPTVANPLQQLIARGATPHFRSRRRIGRSLRQTLQKLRLTSYKYRPWLRSCKPDFVLISFSCHTDDPQIANSCHALGIPVRDRSASRRPAQLDRPAVCRRIPSCLRARTPLLLRLGTTTAKSWNPIWRWICRRPRSWTILSRFALMPLRVGRPLRRFGD